MLLERGVAPDTADSEGTSCLSKVRNEQERNHVLKLFQAAVRGHYETAKLLLERGADANSCDRKRNTPLHHTAFHGYTKGFFFFFFMLLRGLFFFFLTVKFVVANLLLDHGANPNLVNVFGQTALDRATQVSGFCFLGKKKQIIYFFSGRAAVVTRCVVCWKILEEFICRAKEARRKSEARRMEICQKDLWRMRMLELLLRQWGVRSLALRRKRRKSLEKIKRSQRETVGSRRESVPLVPSVVSRMEQPLLLLSWRKLLSQSKKKRKEKQEKKKRVDCPIGTARF